MARVCRAQVRVARNENDMDEEAKFLLLAEALEGKAAQYPDKGVQKLPESHGNRPRQARSIRGLWSP